MKVTCLTFNQFQENTYLLHDDTKECVVVDPGCYDKHEQEELKKYIADNDLKVVRLLNTHCHIDHVLGNKFVADTYNVELEIHPEDEQTLRSVPAYAPVYGFPMYAEQLPAKYLKEGDTVKFGSTELDVIFAPGHAPGHVVFYNKEEKKVIGGDVLFQGSIGRTDLPGGDFDTLIQSIKTKLFTLPDDVTVYPGHGPETTIGYEKKYNPFLR
ncbi:MBL fold metallo-hydrolase [Pontibacter cellulosilyticus]|uniref:MBL fold metallo-hydrolase n=1 Tax=Pontibacter cellulosilyticus TaxID=1720253 RepID=A0A923N8R9_9BACT|nr:MBL fold metallo-hydrolase [Pontibacter cellulosilyticus]MBC5993824.1 MBL fold metallo-hydrolase [Pontibacter cellulosilyticus]